MNFQILINNIHRTCPVCTITVGLGLGLAKYFKIDDTITGVWIGAVLAISIYWFKDWIHKKYFHQHKEYQIMLILPFAALTYGGTYMFLQSIGEIGSPYHKLWGIDKLALGITVGSLLLWAGTSLHYYLKKKNNNKVYVPFQKVIAPVAILIIASIIFYYCTNK